MTYLLTLGKVFGKKYKNIVFLFSYFTSYSTVSLGFFIIIIIIIIINIITVIITLFTLVS